MPGRGLSVGITPAVLIAPSQGRQRRPTRTGAPQGLRAVRSHTAALQSLSPLWRPDQWSSPSAPGRSPAAATGTLGPESLASCGGPELVRYRRRLGPVSLASRGGSESVRYRRCLGLESLASRGGPLPSAPGARVPRLLRRAGVRPLPSAPGPESPASSTRAGTRRYRLRDQSPPP